MALSNIDNFNSAVGFAFIDSEDWKIIENIADALDSSLGQQFYHFYTVTFGREN